MNNSREIQAYIVVYNCRREEHMDYGWTRFVRKEVRMSIDLVIDR